MPQFLVTRGFDLVFFLVEWSGFTLEFEGEPGSPGPVWKASPRARIVVHLPPQAIGEQPLPPVMPIAPAFGLVVGAHLAGPSKLSFTVTPGTLLEPSAAGVLKVLDESAQAPMPEAPAEEQSAIEMPWRFNFSPHPQSGEARLSFKHASRPVASPFGAVGLWRTRLRATDAHSSGARLKLVPLPPGEPVGGFDTIPLFAEHRQRIFEQGVPPQCGRLELSTLGGSMTAGVRFTGFEWEHSSTLGRDSRVKVAVEGMLFPYGHRAVYQEVVQRNFVMLHEPPVGPEVPFPNGDTTLPEDPPDSMAIAGLQVERTLFILDPLRGRVEGDARLEREFPFSEVEVLEQFFDHLGEPDNPQMFLVTAGQGGPVGFPLRCRAHNGDVFLRSPMVFISDAMGAPDPGFVENEFWSPHKEVAVPAASIDMVGGGKTRALAADVVEVHQMTVTAKFHVDGWRARLTGFAGDLPALRSLVPGVPGPSELKRLTFTEEFLSAGDSAQAALKLERSIDLDFTKDPLRSGALMAPKFAVDVISRELGPVPAAVLSGQPDLSWIQQGASFFGLSLKDLLKAAGVSGPLQSPAIVQEPGPPAGARMEWRNLELKNHSFFQASDGTSPAKLDLTVKTTPPEFEIRCVVHNFSVVLPKEKPLLVLRFRSLAFEQLPGSPPDLQIAGLRVEFHGDLQLLADLQRELQGLLGGLGPVVKALPSAISVAYVLAIPDVTSGVFVLQNIAVRLGVLVPFNGDPITVSVAFASRDNPFNLTVNALGGGGYLDFEMGGRAGGDVELTRLEASLEFGARVAFNVFIAEGEVYALGGVRFLQIGSSIAIEAFIRIGGSVEVLGLVSVSIELLIVLRYEAPPKNRLAGRATLVVEVDLTLFSKKVEIDSGEWELIGSASPALRPLGPGEAPLDDDIAGLDEWVRYRRAFAPV